MKISNKLFASILIEKLKKAENDLKIANDFLYNHGFGTTESIRATPEKQEAANLFENEIENKYPEVYKNITKTWTLVRETHSLIKELLDGINK